MGRRVLQEDLAKVPVPQAFLWLRSMGGRRIALSAFVSVGVSVMSVAISLYSLACVAVSACCVGGGR